VALGQKGHKCLHEDKSSHNYVEATEYSEHTKMLNEPFVLSIYEGRIG